MSTWRLTRLGLLIGGTLAWAGVGGAAESLAAEVPQDACGSACQREDVFDFVKQPAFRRVAQDRYEITFTSKGRCDATVGIMDDSGAIVRHLACGVLGANAPAPLKKDVLEQTLIWDGKDDLGRYVEAPEKCRVKVGLGLKPELDKILLWHPKRLGQAIFGLACDKDGVYILDYNNGAFSREGMDAHKSPDLTHILKYDHQANYVRTIYPFPHDKVQPDTYARSPLHGQGLSSVPEPAARTPAARNGPPFSFVLPSGRAVISPDPASPCGQGSYFPHVIEDNAFVVGKGVLTLVYKENLGQQGLRFMRLGTDGSMPQGGYRTGELVLDGVSGPCWLSISPGGEWMYVSGLGARVIDGFTVRWVYPVMKKTQTAEHAVYRMRYDKPAPASEPFLGVKGEPGDDNAHFRFPEGVACDQDGRVYVADSGNNRVQVFDAAGKFLKSLPVPEPYAVAVHKGNGAIYVASFEYKLGQLIVSKFNGLSDTGAPVRWVYEAGCPTNPAWCYNRKTNPKAAWPGTWQAMGVWLPVLCVDEWAAEPTVWTENLDGDLMVLTDKGDRFVARNLQDEWRKEWKAKGWDAINPDCNLGNIVADPRRPFIYLGDADGKGNHDWITELTRTGWNPRINVETGEVHYVPAVSAMGFDGLIYNQQGQRIWRLDPATGKPIAFDYGGGKSGDISYSFCSGFSDGFGIAPRGAVYFHDIFPPMPGITADPRLLAGDWRESRSGGHGGPGLPGYLLPESTQITDEKKSLRGYKPRPMFPGGMYRGSSAIVKFNENGQLEENNLIAGLPRDLAGLQVDGQGNVYVGLYFAKAGPDGKPLTGRAIAKFKPEGGRIVVNGTAVPVPLTEELKRPPDFLTLGYTGGRLQDSGPGGKPGRVGDKAWAEGMLWSIGGYTWEERMPARFALDYYGRLFMPEVHRNSVAIVDGDGNFIMRVGEYGNQDDRGPEIRLADTRFVGVSETRLFINDAVNKRILSVKLNYQKEVEAGLAP